jgi:hypothetical protein
MCCPVGLFGFNQHDEVVASSERLREDRKIDAIVPFPVKLEPIDPAADDSLKYVGVLAVGRVEHESP